MSACSKLGYSRCASWIITVWNSIVVILPHWYYWPATWWCDWSGQSGLIPGVPSNSVLGLLYISIIDLQHNHNTNIHDSTIMIPPTDSDHFSSFMWGVRSAWLGLYPKIFQYWPRHSSYWAIQLDNWFRHPLTFTIIALGSWCPVPVAL